MISTHFHILLINLEIFSSFVEDTQEAPQSASVQSDRC